LKELYRGSLHLDAPPWDDFEVSAVVPNKADDATDGTPIHDEPL
jgi:hypothetical protein